MRNSHITSIEAFRAGIQTAREEHVFFLIPLFISFRLRYFANALYAMGFEREEIDALYQRAIEKPGNCWIF